MTVSTAITISTTVRFLSVSSSSLTNDIKHCRDRFFWLFIACTFLVLLGVILEEVKFRAGEAYVDSETGAFVPERTRQFAKLGLLLLVIGIAGEGIFEMATSWADAILQDFNNTQLLLEWDQTVIANKKSSDANVRAAKFEKDAAQFHKDAESERLARVKIEASVAPRRLSPEQLSTGIPSLKEFHKGNVTEVVLITYPASSAEAYSFATDVATLLRANEWYAFAPSGVMDLSAPGIPVATGISVRSGKNDTDRSAAKALLKVLTDFGFDATSGEELNSQGVDIGVEVNLRPQGPQGEYKLRAEQEARARNKSK